jgi:hypothetical protein
LTTDAVEVRVRGSGRALVAAYGVADAEHQVEKELSVLLPEAAVEVLEVGRTGTGRIVEEFAVAYRLRVALAVPAPSPDEARRDALRTLRDRFAGTRYERVAWEMEPETAPSAGAER